MEKKTLKTCCVTGHREIAKDKINDVYKKLEQEIQEAIDDGFTRFISGFALGSDLMFMEILVKKKDKFPNLILEAALPYANRVNEGGQKLKSLLNACDHVEILCQEYKPSCYMIK